MDHNIFDHLPDAIPPVLLVRPDRHIAPIIFVSSHSGRDYPPRFVAEAQLDPVSLRHSEDSFVDDLCGAAVTHGAPLLLATFPRAYCDANREKWELDQAMFADALPTWVNTSSARVGAGLGTVARVVASGQPIYREKLQFSDVARRINACWQPFHDQLTALVTETRLHFGGCLVIDCHSMPTPIVIDRHIGRDSTFILGDSFGQSCDTRLTKIICSTIKKANYKVLRNVPYAGGYITKTYGQPKNNIHTIQVEIPRQIYMNEYSVVPSKDYIMTKRIIEMVIIKLTEFAAEFNIKK